MEMDNRMKKARTTAEWFEALDHLNSEPFLCDRAQLVTPKGDIFDADCSNNAQQGESEIIFNHHKYKQFES